jgi:hypothetical protein
LGFGCRCFCCVGHGCFPFVLALSQVRCPQAPIEFWSAAARPIPLRAEFSRGVDSFQLRGSPFGASPCGNLLRAGYSTTRGFGSSHRWTVVWPRSAQDDDFVWSEKARAWPLGQTPRPMTTTETEKAPQLAELLLFLTLYL